MDNITEAYLKVVGASMPAKNIVKEEAEIENRWEEFARPGEESYMGEPVQDGMIEIAIKCPVCGRTETSQVRLDDWSDYMQGGDAVTCFADPVLVRALDEDTCCSCASAAEEGEDGESSACEEKVLEVLASGKKMRVTEIAELLDMDIYPLQRVLDKLLSSRQVKLTESKPRPGKVGFKLYSLM